MAVKIASFLRNVGIYLRVHTASQPRRTSVIFESLELRFAPVLVLVVKFRLEEPRIKEKPSRN
jgi:hypothetical protein